MIVVILVVLTSERMSTVSKKIPERAVRQIKRKETSWQQQLQRIREDNQQNSTIVPDISDPAELSEKDDNKMGTCDGEDEDWVDVPINTSKPSVTFDDSIEMRDETMNRLGQIVHLQLHTKRAEIRIRRRRKKLQNSGRRGLIGKLRLRNEGVGGAGTEKGFSRKD